MDNFGEQFYNPEKELDDKYLNEIHMHKIMRGARKSDVIVQGLVFASIDDTKKFISTITSKLGVGGSHKMIKEYDTVNKVFLFSGDKRDEIKDILVNDYGKEEEFIKYHG